MGSRASAQPLTLRPSVQRWTGLRASTSFFSSKLLQQAVPGYLAYPGNLRWLLYSGWLLPLAFSGEISDEEMKLCEYWKGGHLVVIAPNSWQSRVTTSHLRVQTAARRAAFAGETVELRPLVSPSEEFTWRHLFESNLFPVSAGDG